MKTIAPLVTALLACARLTAHDLTATEDGHSHTHDMQAAAASTPAPPQATAFAKFAPAVQTRWDDKFLFIEGNGLPAHDMMVGITAWQQQVPLPQDYTGANAWRLPLAPVPAEKPATIRDRFLRGAIAIAVNGIPIFNPQNNRGEISLDIGELDHWGGHCGRADDYHYHVAPLHLQKVTGPALPIAYALDGYPVYGLTEPDGSQPTGLDELRGHTAPGLGYHYHASEHYPFVMGGFHGQVTERDGKVDPQPRATPVREALQALRGANITGFEKTGPNSNRLGYEVNGEKRAVSYAVNADGSVAFEFHNGRDGTVKETYTRRERGAGQGGPPPDAGRPRPPRNKGGGDRRGTPRDDRRPDQNRPQAGASPFGPYAMKKPQTGFLLTSPAVKDGGELPVDYTGDGVGETLPLEWKGTPAGTKGYALIMDHAAPGNEMKWYWTMWDIPASVTSLPKNVRDIGKVGTGFKGRVGYEPPHSQGPGAKTYVITLYALSGRLQVPQDAGEVDRDVLLAAMKDKVLASSSLNVISTSGGGAQGGDRRPPRRDDAGEGRRNARPASPPGLVKPTIEDTIKLNVYADNWFMLFVNDRPVAVDPIPFTPHNVVSVDFLPEYPMTIAVLAKDNANPKTGMEYGTSIGDGGFILKFGDGTVTNATWKAKCFFHGPVDGDTANPRVKSEPLPDKWWSAGFDDSAWPHATEFTVEAVAPKQPFFDSDFEGARFIWTKDLALDNTVIFRTRIEKPGWTPRWNTKPDLDVSGPAGASRP